jgi:hypothetical protein
MAEGGPEVIRADDTLRVMQPGGPEKPIGRRGAYVADTVGEQP